MGVLGDVLIVFYEATLPLNLEGRKPTQLERNRNSFLQRFFFHSMKMALKSPLLLFVIFFPHVSQSPSLHILCCYLHLLTAM